MAYFIEARRELELPKLRDVTLQAISKLKYRGGNYRTKPIDPFIWDSKEGWDLYMLGRIIDRTGFTSLVANYIKDHRFCGPDFFRITEELDFLPANDADAATKNHYSLCDKWSRDKGV